MAFCGKCGAYIEGAGNFCPKCGAPIPAAAPNPNHQPPQQAQRPTQQGYQQPQSPISHAAEPIAAGNVAEGAMAVLSYFSLLVLVPIFAGKHSRYARYHANQGLTLLLLQVAWSIVIAIITAIISAIVFKSNPWAVLTVGGVMNVIKWLGSAFCLVLAIFGIINCCKGRMKELPLIGRIKLLKDK